MSVNKKKRFNLNKKMTFLHWSCHFWILYKTSLKLNFNRVFSQNNFNFKVIEIAIVPQTRVESGTIYKLDQLSKAHSIIGGQHYKWKETPERNLSKCWSKENGYEKRRYGKGRNSHRRCSIKKLFLKISLNWQVNISARVSWLFLQNTSVALFRKG